MTDRQKLTPAINI